MITIENCIDYNYIFLNIAEFLRVKNSQDIDNQFHTSLATYESTVVTSCFCECKTFNFCDDVQFNTLKKETFHAFVFSFSSTKEIIAFVKCLSDFKSQFIKHVKLISQYVCIQKITSHVIEFKIHINFSYHCKNAAEQNIITIIIQHICNKFMKSFLAKKLHVVEIIIKSKLSFNKKSS